MKKLPLVGAAALALSLAGSLAQAASFDLWRNYGSKTQSSFTFMDDGITLEITGGSYAGGNAPLQGLTFENTVHQSVWGMSVLRPYDDTHQLDGNGPPEFLRFTFSEKVTIQSIVFTAVDDNDNFDMGIDGTDIGVYTSFGTDRLIEFPNAGLPDIPYDHRVTFSGDVQFRPEGGSSYFAMAMGTFFDFYPNAKYDNFKIAQIIVEPAPVPLPAGLPMLLMGAGLLGFVGRRRKAA